jgi:hypothetical protein
MMDTVLSLLMLATIALVGGAIFSGDGANASAPR